MNWPICGVRNNVCTSSTDRETSSTWFWIHNNWQLKWTLFQSKNFRNFLPFIVFYVWNRSNISAFSMQINNMISQSQLMANNTVWNADTSHNWNFSKLYTFQWLGKNDWKSKIDAEILMVSKNVLYFDVIISPWKNKLNSLRVQ